MNFIAFKGVDEKTFQIYEFDGNNWYLNLKDKNAGFQKQEVEKYKSNFLFANTLDGIQEAVRIAEYQLNYGTGKNGDVKCPNCGFWHNFPSHVDYNDGYYEPGIIESFSSKRKCLCGKTFEFKIKEVKVIWETKELTC